MKVRENLVLRKRASGSPSMGVNIQTASPENVEMVGAAGYDFAVIDCEHGSVYIDGLPEMLRAADAAGVTPIVRVPELGSNFILRALDSGAMGVIVPNVRNRADAELAVSAAKFKDLENFGARGSCPSTRANWHLATDWQVFADWSNQQTMVWLLIESAEGARNIDEILAVPGISAIVPGPFDLAQSMGYPNRMREPAVVEALASMCAKAAAKGIDTVAVLLANDQEALQEEVAFWSGLGTSIFWVGGDRRMFSVALRNRMTQVQACLPGKAPAPDA